MRPRKNMIVAHKVWEAKQEDGKNTRDLNTERKTIEQKPRRHNNGNYDR